MRRFWMLVIAGVGLGYLSTDAGASPEQAYTLVMDGKPTSVIVVPRQPADHAAMWSAMELQKHFQKITGAQVPIRFDDEVLDGSPVRISVGDTALSRAAGLDMGRLGAQEYVQQFEPGLIVLMGRDVYPNPWPLECPGIVSTNGRFGLGSAGGVVALENHKFPDQQGSVEAWVSADAKGILWKVGNQEQEPKDHYQTFSFSPDDNVMKYRSVVNGEEALLKAPMDTVTAKGWHLVTATWDAVAGKKQILVDGKVVAEGPYKQTQCAGSKWFSVGGGKGNPWWWGGMDDFRLSRDIVRAYPNGVEKKPFIKDEYTKLLLHFDEPGGVTYDGEPPTREIAKGDAYLPDAFDPIATTYAAYDFLERYCDVRWYSPTELGTVVPSTNALVIKNPANLKRKPWLRGRVATDIEGNAPEIWGNRMNNFLYNHASVYDGVLFKLRLRAGGQRLTVNHSFYAWYDKYWEKSTNNPGLFVEKRSDWFAKKEDGSPFGNPPYQLCYTHTGVIAQVIADAKQAYAYGTRVFGVVPMDNHDFCQCTNCKTLLNLTTNKIQGFSNSDASELMWWFTDQIARGVAKDCPDLLIGQLAYADYAAPPRTVALASNITSGPCFSPNVFDTLDDSNPNSAMGLYRQWVNMKKKSGMVLGVWIYQCFPNESGGQRGFKNWPGFHSKRLGIYMRMMQQDKIDAVFLCGISSFIDGYITFRMMDDATLDTDAVLDEFFPRYFGKAGTPMRKFYDTVEASYMEQIGGGGTIDSYDRYNIRDIMKNCGQWIAEAEKLAETDAEKKRVALFKDGVWEHMTQGYKDYLAHYNGHPPFPLSYRTDTKPTERVEGKFGNALKLGQLIGVWNPGFSDAAGTVEFWFKARETGGILFNIHTDRPDPGHVHLADRPDSGHEIGRGDSVLDPKTKEKGYKYYYRSWARGVTNQILTPPLTGGWHHIAARWSAKDGKLQLSLDGKSVGTTKYVKTRCSGAHRFAIGGTTGTFGTWGDGGNSWGLMDEFRLSKILRPPSLPTKAPTPDKDTLLLLHFDEENGQFPIESSGRDWRGNAGEKTAKK